jgi:hypothetical protein
MNGAIDASNAGFRGAPAKTGTSASTTDLYAIRNSTECYGFKGEGICGSPAYSGSSSTYFNEEDNGRGAPGNAGGGASGNDVGAGGGGNGGAGGNGGGYKDGDLGLGYGGAAVSSPNNLVFFGKRNKAPILNFNNVI